MSPLLIVWVALWRAQVSHLLVFAALPLLAFALRAALGLIFLPFLLLSFGNRNVTAGAELAHLPVPGCWLALAPCPIADLTLLPSLIASGNSATGERLPAPPKMPVAAEPAEAFIPMPTSVTLRHAWFGIWLVWFIAHLVRRGRRLQKKLPSH